MRKRGQSEKLAYVVEFSILVENVGRLNPESKKKGEPFCQLCFIKGLKRDADGFALADVLLL